MKYFTGIIISIGLAVFANIFLNATPIETGMIYLLSSISIRLEELK